MAGANANVAPYAVPTQTQATCRAERLPVRMSLILLDPETKLLIILFSCAIAVALIFGLWMEIVQVFVPGRVVDMDDVLLNTVGIAMAAGLILWRRVSVEHEAQSSGSSFCPDIR